MSNTRLLMIWLGRVLANSLAGGLAFAVVGAFCGGAMGLLLGFIIGVGGAGVMIGAAIGAVTGVVGILITAIATIGEPPGDLFEPFFEITARIAFGQIWGTIAAFTAFLAFELVRSMFNGIGFSKFSDHVGEDTLLMMLIAPVLMICGATMSAIFRRD